MARTRRTTAPSPSRSATGGDRVIDCGGNQPSEKSESRTVGSLRRGHSARPLSRGQTQVPLIPIAPSLDQRIKGQQDNTCTEFQKYCSRPREIPCIVCRPSDESPGAATPCPPPILS